MPDIILTTLNARYIHASLGLRYLYANLDELQPRAKIVEYVIATKPLDIIEDLLAHKPMIIGFGVYIWNIEETTHIVAMLKRLRPDIRIVLGGPEVSYEYETQSIVSLADVVITGMADKMFAAACRQLLAGQTPATKIIAAPSLPLNEIAMPYRYYNDDDIANRIIYVEASRGCPFKCEFCLSALDKTAWPFDLELFLGEMKQLHERGVRHFKFVDRTFNLKIETSIKIMEFFLARIDEKLFLHFELIPDHLPEKLKTLIEKFPAGTLQFEIGIQTLNPEVQSLISRRQNNEKAEQNIRWLREQSQAHLHTDLIAGLPGETLSSFGQGFDRLVAMNPHEIQLGILKRLRGTPIIRHTADYAMCYNPYPPYNILSTRDMEFTTLQRLNRFARYWDVMMNSARFPHTRPYLLADQPFARFMRFSDWLYVKTGATHKLALERFFDYVHEWLVDVEGSVDSATAKIALTEDYILTGLKTLPKCVDLERIKAAKRRESREGVSTVQRQMRHQSLN
jgi:radical SAM superfamily enzyme YgiQ (UPF0313 family)